MGLTPVRVITILMLLCGLGCSSANTSDDYYGAWTRAGTPAPREETGEVKAATADDLDNAEVATGDAPVEEKKPADKKPPLPGWNLTVMPYAWWPRIEGDITVKRSWAEIGAGTSNDIGFAPGLYAELGKGKWALFFDGTYFEATDTKYPLFAKVDTELTMTMLQLGLSYRAINEYFGSSKDQRWWLDLQLGARYIEVSERIETRLVSVSEEGLWWPAPSLGGRIGYTWKDRITLNLRSDIFGIDIDNIDYFIWHTDFGADFRLNDHVSLTFGYKFYIIDFTYERKDKSAEVDANIGGPWVGLKIDF